MIKLLHIPTGYIFTFSNYLEFLWVLHSKNVTVKTYNKYVNTALIFLDPFYNSIDSEWVISKSAIRILSMCGGSETSIYQYLYSKLYNLHLVEAEFVVIK